MDIDAQGNHIHTVNFGKYNGCHREWPVTYVLVWGHYRSHTRIAERFKSTFDGWNCVFMIFYTRWQVEWSTNTRWLQALRGQPRAMERYWSYMKAMANKGFNSVDELQKATRDVYSHGKRSINVWYMVVKQSPIIKDQDLEWSVYFFKNFAWHIIHQIPHSPGDVYIRLRPDVSLSHSLNFTALHQL